VVKPFDNARTLRLVLLGARPYQPFELIDSQLLDFRAGNVQLVRLSANCWPSSFNRPSSISVDKKKHVTYQGPSTSVMTQTQPLPTINWLSG
jgi:hypothetical protein